MKYEVMIIRVAPTAGGGCCGGLLCDGFIKMENVFHEDFGENYQMGQIYRTLKNQLQKDVEIFYVDPRNVLSLWGYHLHQWRKQRITLREALRAIFMQHRRSSIFVNGIWLNEDGELNDQTLLQRIEDTKA